MNDKERKKKQKKKPRDPNQMAQSIVNEATSESPDEETTDYGDKNPAAVELGRLGGLKGGKARAEKLTKKRRQEIARKAAKARWDKKKTD